MGFTQVTHAKASEELEVTHAKTIMELEVTHTQTTEKLKATYVEQLVRAENVQTNPRERNAESALDECIAEIDRLKKAESADADVIKKLRI